MNDRARKLRAQSPGSERLLWHHLRNRRIAGHKFRRQHPIGPYFADFVCVETKLVVEIDGSQHAESRRYDEARTEYLESQGYRVVRFWNHDVIENRYGVLEAIQLALRKRRQD